MSRSGLELRASFELHSLSGRDLVELMESVGLGFEPRFLRNRGLTRGFEPVTSDLIERLRSWDGKTNLELRAAATTDRAVSFRGLSLPDWELQTFSWKGLPASFDPTPLVNWLMENAGFSAAYFFEEDDVARQSTEALSTYEARGWKAEALAFVEDPSFPDRRIDISGNPGRATLLRGLWFIAAPRIWLGGRALDYFPRRLVEGFPGAVKIDAEKKNVVSVQLTPGISDPGTESGRRAQAALRSWLGVDAIAEAQSRSVGGGGPGFLIEEGSYPHGGVRRVTISSNLEGRVVRRNEAHWTESFELDPRGRILWRSGRLLAES